MIRVVIATALALGFPPALAANEARDAPIERSNTEIKALFDADQAARMDEDADWEKITREDTARRSRVHAMLSAQELRSAEDYYHAAFIFQHSHDADDYLLAHALAVTAVTKGHKNAPWIAAATLDRYLHAIGKAQIYGTQEHLGPNDELTAEPYNRNMISDAVRKVAKVPSLADQR